MSVIAPMIEVLNADTRRIVMLPLANKAVIEQNKVYHHLSTNIPAIDDQSYQTLATLLALPAVDINATRNYFSARCVNFIGEDKPSVSVKGYGFIFDLLSDAGADIKLMIERLEHIIYSWNEEDSETVLNRLYAGFNDTSSITTTAIEVIKSENVTEAFVTSYQDADRTVILYCDSDLKLVPQSF